MPRSLRVFVEGGIYHVYNRFASGESVFADSEEALEFIELLRYVKQRNGWTVFADIDMADLASRSRQHHVVEARRLIVTLGRERWAQGTKELALAFGKSADTVTYIQREGIRQILEGGDFSRRYESLDEGLIGEGRDFQ
jgi:hypothetical protein